MGHKIIKFLAQPLRASCPLTVTVNVVAVVKSIQKQIRISIQKAEGMLIKKERYYYGARP